MSCEKDRIELVVVEKPNYMLMSLQRIALIIIVVASVVFVVYVTPMPEEYFSDCDRECNELDWPMICRVKLTVEVYKTLSRSCGTCPESPAGCAAETCIAADGRERGVLAANRKLPAPALRVCHNDILVVDVQHRAPAHALAIHWRGQPQLETPFMDGAPMLTQCPQPAYTTFQYKFRASAVGTHMYHAHSGAEAADGLSGALIVRQSPRIEKIRKYYDEDLSDHTIFIGEWGRSMGTLAGLTLQTPKAETILINGRGNTSESPETPLTVFTVTPNKRYRFRTIYAGGAKSCPVTLSIDEHTITLIALDGHPIEPEIVNSIELSKGERADFVLESKKPVSTYAIRVSATKCQDQLQGQAELKYKGTASNKMKVLEVRDIQSDRKFSTVSDACKNDDKIVCVKDVRSPEVLPEELAAATLDKTLYVPFNYSTRQTSARRVESWGISDGYRFTYPASPLLTQFADVSPDTLCDLTTHEDKEECVHVKPVPLHATVELIMIDQGGESNHVFHLHGYSFFVVGVKQFNNSLDKDTIIKMHQENILFSKKNLKNPVRKDTINIPRFGVVALRFKADNPGYWLMRDEGSSHWTRGLDFVIKVGDESDFVKAPVDFPKCGSYVGPEYFLI